MQHAEELENKGVESSGAAVSGEHEIEIDADLGAQSSTATQAARAPQAKTNGAVVNTTVTKSSVTAAAARSNPRVEEETFELSDDEIQPADAADRPSLLPGSSRHRPPPLPSTRPRSPGASSLPPPVRPTVASSTLWASTYTATQAKNRISALEHEVEEARWQLANRALELTRLKGRCAELESALSVRDRQIAALERRLFEAEGGVPSSVVVDVSEASVSDAVLEATPAPAAASAPAPSTQPSRSEPARELPSAPTTVPSAAISSVIKAEASKATTTSAASVDETPLPEDTDELFTPTPSPAEVAGSWNGGPDELARISGINPGIAQSLRAQGVSRLSQIAAWSDDDVRRIAKAIKVPKSRISRGRWVQKAREALAVASNANLAREDEAPVSTSNV